MNSTNIENVLKSFTDNNSMFNTLLIDGPWGCGKTYAVKKYIEEEENNGEKNKQFYYVSLFGLETIDEINTALFYQVNPSAEQVEKLKNAACVITKAISPFNAAFEAVNSFLSDFSVRKDVSKKYIIFDDLDRMSKNIEYTDLLGYFNRLVLSGCKIVAIISTRDGLLDEDRSQDFYKFSEKIFDSITLINESSYHVIAGLFQSEEYEVRIDEEICGLFDFNIRTAEKTKMLFSSVMEFVKNSSVDYSSLEYSTEDILKACIYCNKICFENKPIDKMKDDDSKWSDNLFVEWKKKILGEKFARKLLFYKNEDQISNTSFLSLITVILSFSLFKDNSALTNIFSVKRQEEDILDDYLFYLSDENREKYIEEAHKYLNGDFEWDKKTTQIISQLISDTSESFSDKEMHNIADTIFKQNDRADTNTVTSAFWAIADKAGVSEKLNKFANSINEILIELFEEKNKALLQQSCDNYHALKTYIKELGYLEDQRANVVNKIFVDNDFYFPNLSRDINNDIWTYSHAITKYAKEHGLEKELMSVFEKRMEENNSMTQREKFEFLKSNYNLK